MNGLRLMFLLDVGPPSWSSSEETYFRLSRRLVSKGVLSFSFIPDRWTRTFSLVCEPAEPKSSPRRGFTAPGIFTASSHRCSGGFRSTLLTLCPFPAIPRSIGSSGALGPQNRIFRRERLAGEPQRSVALEENAHSGPTQAWMPAGLAIHCDLGVRPKSTGGLWRGPAGSG